MAKIPQKSAKRTWKIPQKDFRFLLSLTFFQALSHIVNKNTQGDHMLFPSFMLRTLVEIADLILYRNCKPYRRMLYRRAFKGMIENALVRPRPMRVK